MGVSSSCLFGDYIDVGRAVDSILIKAINLRNDEPKLPAKTIGSDDGDSGNCADSQMAYQCSVSFKGRRSEMLISVRTPQRSYEQKNVVGEPLSTGSDESRDDEESIGTTKQMTVFDPSHPRHEAAVKLQKVYKSFRTRRKLADCAVLVEQSWWKLLDFAELKHSSVSFFDGEKHETAISRWSRARTRAAKVGKGLSKNDKAQKLALQHWLEAIDPRHRYGHNLHLYYVKWLQSQSREPFFYWLDIGEGKEVNLERCPRLKLQQQCIKYLGPMERKSYEVAIEGGKLYYKQSGELLDTTGEPSAKWIFVLSTSKIMYVGKKKKGTFQHSSFLAGGAATAAGRLIVDHGMLQAVWPHSGHYRPTEENFKDFLSFLRDNDVDLTDVKLSPVDEDEKSSSRKNSMSNLLNVASEDDLMQKEGSAEVNTRLTQADVDSSENETILTDMQLPQPRRLSSFSEKLADLEIPTREIVQRTDSGHLFLKANEDDCHLESPVDDYEMADEVPQKAKGGRIELKPLQVGKQLSCKWTTGAGPRIGYVRDHPQEVQVRALEHVNLSPRSGGSSKSCFSPRSGSRLTPATQRPVSASAEPK